MWTSFATNMNMSVKRSYHHGNLRKALLDAGVALIGEVGPKGFTIREVARRAGVSHNAPYRHFRDKDELLEAIAVEGFERLTAAMKKRSGAGVTAAGRLRLCGCGYVDFALRWPQHFLVMFDLPYRENPKHDTVAENAFQTLLGFIIESQKEGALPEEIRIHWHLWLGPWCMVSQNWRSAENCPTVPNRFLISLKSPQRHS